MKRSQMKWTLRGISMVHDQHLHDFDIYRAVAA